MDDYFRMPDHAYGWLPSIPDIRDYSIDKLPRKTRVRPPSRVDLRNTGWVPDVKDQSYLGSCTANGACAQIEFEENRMGDPDAEALSRLWLYYREREMIDTVYSDSGAFPRDAFKIANDVGVPTEAEYPYDLRKWRNTPPTFADQLEHKVLVYASVPQMATAIEFVLASETCVGFGFTVYESFESSETNRTGMVKMPSPTEKVLGGHYIYIVGYTFINRRRYFIMRNSWSTGIGDNGDYYFPTAYVTNPQLAGDLWAVQSVAQ